MQRRRRAIVPVALLASALAVASPASSAFEPDYPFEPDFAVAPASTAPPCTGWANTYAPPATIRVGITDLSGGPVTAVATVPFLAYVQTVLAAEWGGSSSVYLQIGALAVKQYGWYWTMHGRSTYRLGSQCYDVRNDTNDQLYDPAHRTASTAQKVAITATWGTSLRQGGIFFLPHYNGVGTSCGTLQGSTRTFLPQRAVGDCVAQGWTRNKILHLYFDYVGAPPSVPSRVLSIADLVDLAGGDRYATAVALSAWHFPAAVPVVYVATGVNFPDALAAGPAAALLGGPVLLLPPGDAVPQGVGAELQRLAPATIKVLGGPTVVSDAQKDALVAYVAGKDPTKVERIFGPDRYGTAIEIAKRAFPDGSPAAPTSIVFLATGLNFPDALSGAAAGARLKGPVLLVDPDRTLAAQPALRAELTRLHPAKIRVLGGAGVFPEELLTDLAPFAPSVLRLAGASRYETAAVVSAATYAPGGPYLYLTTALNFPDALAAGALGGPLLLVPNSGFVPFAVLYETGRLAPQRLAVLGTSSLIEDSVIAGAAGAQEFPPTPTPGPSPTPTPTPSPTPSPSPSPTPTPPPG